MWFDLVCHAKSNFGIFYGCNWFGRSRGTTSRCRHWSSDHIYAGFSCAWCLWRTSFRYQRLHTIGNWFVHHSWSLGCRKSIDFNHLYWCTFMKHQIKLNMTQFLCRFNTLAPVWIQHDHSGQLLWQMIGKINGYEKSPV